MPSCIEGGGGRVLCVGGGGGGHQVTLASHEVDDRRMRGYS